MKPIRDPEGAELIHLEEACSLADKTVLEIGCGDGAFTRQYARKTRQAIGIDPASSEVQIARRNDRSKQSVFSICQGERLPFPRGYFDLVIFASSL